jgi:hypothetical protein
VLNVVGKDDYAEWTSFRTSFTNLPLFQVFLMLDIFYSKPILNSECF